MEQVIHTNRRCKRCLLSEMVDDDYREHIKVYLDGMDEQEKSPEELYQRRINCCRECEQLTEGICMLCGCYAEFRAAVSKKHCPANPSLW